MTSRFDYFVVFAEMRTGSNFLEANLNALDDVHCHGEAFNPYFIGYPKSDNILGVTLADREADPSKLITAFINSADHLAGFRFFHDHDPRVLDRMLDNPRCAKIILTRNPAESYVSWKIAQATGQWKLTDVKRRKDAKASFDAEDFAAHIDTLQQFQILLLNRLQTSGQTAFYVAYEDLQSIDVMNGLATFLGVSARLDGLDKSLKVQNPAPLSGKVENFDDMQTALATMDPFNLTRTPNFEPRRSAAVPTYVLGHKAPLIFLPIQGGPVDIVERWLADLDGVSVDDLPRRLNQKDLRQWKRAHPTHRSFTVLRHPVARAHRAFCDCILANGPEAYGQIRQTLRKQYGLVVPQDGVGPDWTQAQHREAFAQFLTFLKANLSGRTSIRVDAAWCSQSQTVQGFAQFIPPDFTLRESELATDLPALAARVGLAGALAPGDPQTDQPFQLSDVYDEEIEAIARAAYQRDYMMFGFAAWA